MWNELEYKLKHCRCKIDQLSTGSKIFTRVLSAENSQIHLNRPFECEPLGSNQTVESSTAAITWYKASLFKYQCGDCVLTPGDSERSSFIPGSKGVEETEVDNTELLGSREEEAEGGRDTTIYFCRGREAASPGPLPDSTLTKGCKVEVALGTVLVTGEADWEELRVITYRKGDKSLL